MTDFLYNYESAVLHFLSDALTGVVEYITDNDGKQIPIRLQPLKEATYSPEEHLIDALTNIKYFPYLIYSREATNWEWNKPCPITVKHHDGSATVLRFYPFQQVYHGYFFVEKASQAFEVAATLRDYWQSHYQVMVRCDEAACTDYKDGEEYPFIPTQLRLLYIKVSDTRLPADKIGSLRTVEFSWQSNLFLTNNTANSPISLVDDVNFGISSSTSPAFSSNGDPIPGAITWHLT